MTKAIVFFSVFLLSVPVFAQVQEDVGGVFYADCLPSDAPAVTMTLDNHLRIMVHGSAVKPDEAYRTAKEAFEGEQATMDVSLCDDKMQNCKPIEGVLTTYKSDGEEIEGAIEYFDGTETQGDAESIQGHTSYFKVKKDAKREPASCG